MNSRKNSRAPIVALLLCIFATMFAYSQMKVTTVAGGVVNDGQPATSASILLPRFGAYDAKGNLYIPDYAHRIRKVTPAGIISTIAGNGIAGFSGDGGKAKAAHLSYPVGIVFDAKGNLIFSDSGNNRIRKIDTKGIITTIAGNGTAGFAGDGGAATAAELNGPWGLAVDASGNLYICDQANNRIRKVDTSGIITTVAGNGIAGYTGDGGPAISASINFPFAVLPDNLGDFYIADFYNAVVRKVDGSGTITTFAGNGTIGGCDGDGGPATQALLGGPGGLLISNGSLLIGDNGCSRVRAVNLTTNIITTLAGSQGGFDGDGNPPLSTRFRGERGVFFDPAGNLIIADRGNGRIRKLNVSTQIVTTIAGGFVGDKGPGTKAALNLPQGMGFDAHNNLYIADTENNRVRLFSAKNVITTFAGTSISGYSGDGGPASAALLNAPVSATVDLAGNVFIADESGFIIRKVDTTGTITTIASSNVFGGLTGLATDAAGNLYGADPYYCAVWQITPTGNITAVAGVPGDCGYNSDGIPAAQAWLNGPYGVALDAKGNIYISDQGNSLVRKVDVNTQLISSVAGTAGVCGFSGDGGPATAAQICFPWGVAVGKKGSLYIADYGNGRVRVVDTTGTIQTLAGTGIGGYNGNGLLASETNLDDVVAVAVSSSGSAYLLDEIQERVRKIH